MKSTSPSRRLVFPLAMCVVAVALEGIRYQYNHHSLYHVHVYASFACFVTAFALGAFRSPLLTLPVAVAVGFLVPHETCWMSIGVLPGASIIPSWMLGALAHVIIRSIRAIPGPSGKGEAWDME